MGLNISHGCYAASCRSFTQFRHVLAKAAGYLILKDDSRELTVAIDWPRYELKNYQGVWDKAPFDPLMHLIVHSDCDGVIKNMYLVSIRKRLEGLVDEVIDMEDGGYIQAERIAKFINGIDKALIAKEDLNFS